MPSVHGLELSPGDELGTDIVPDCCDEEMAANDTADGYRYYMCGDCETVLTVLPVASNGIVFDIRP